MIFSTLLFFFISLFQENNGIPYIQNYSKDDFNSRSINHSVSISHSGYVYFGNEDGVLIFDGKKWTLQRIENTQIFSVFIDGSQTIVGGLNEFGIFETSNTGELKYNSLKQDLIKKQNEYPGYTRSIYKNNSGIFFGSDRKITHYLNDNYTIYKSNGKLSKLFNVNGDLYFQDTSKGINEIRDNKFHLIDGTDFFKTMEVTGICKKNDTLIVATKTNGIYKVTKSGITELSTLINSYLREYEITKVSNFRSNDLLIGTVKNGLIVLDSVGVVKEIVNKKKGLIDNCINDFNIDDFGNVWVASNLGASYIHFSVPLHYYKYYSDLKNVIGIQRVKDDLYLATLNGISRINLNKKLLSHTVSIPQQIISDRPYSLHKFKNDILSLSSKGIRKNNEEKILPIEADRFFSISKIDPNLIYSNHNGRLKRYIFKNGQFTFQDSLPVNTGSVTTLQEINDNIWLGTKENGVFKLKLKKGKFINYENHKYVNGKLIDQTFLSKIKDTLYISSKKKLYYFDFSQQKIVTSKDQRLHVNFGTDFQNQVWYFKWQTKHVRILNKPTLSLLLNTLPRSVLYTVHHDLFGNTWFGFEDGFVQYHTKYKKDIDQPFPVSITEITLNQDSLLFGGFHPPGKNSHTFSISYNQNQLRFQYAAAYYEMPERTTYSYKLEGYDKNWSTYSSETFKDYTGLYEGNYIFKVRAKNVYETLGTTANYVFTILPPWYRSIWAYIIYVIIFFYLSYLFNALITSRKIKRLNEQRRIEIAEGKARESELKIQIEKERMRTRISEDLHDEIGSNLSYIQLMSEVLEKRNNTSGDQKEFKNVSESASEMSQAMRDIVWFVKPENDTYEMFINKLSEVTEKFLDPFELSFSTEIEHLDRNLDINIKRNIYLILKEILQNIIKHSEAKHIKVHISDKNNMFKISVKDNGKGFDSSLNKRGNGLINYQKRAEKINGGVFVSTRIGEGTEVTLEVKF